MASPSCLLGAEVTKYSPFTTLISVLRLIQSIIWMTSREAVPASDAKVGIDILYGIIHKLPHCMECVMFCHANRMRLWIHLSSDLRVAAGLSHRRCRCTSLHNSCFHSSRQGNENLSGAPNITFHEPNKLLLHTYPLQSARMGHLRATKHHNLVTCIV